MKAEAARRSSFYLMYRVHPFYGYGLAALIAGQALTMWIALTGPALWLELARVLSR